MPYALIGLNKCHPEHCTGGICFVRKNCPTRAVSQGEPYDSPMVDWMRCRGCSKCVATCPLKAIKILQ